tara:strand:- start:363 stop:1325 length:963 start_codon:yes stop_codon:yes gene_type:complete
MHRSKISLFSNLITLFDIWNFFRKEKPDIAHLVTIKPYLYGGIISRLIPVPCLVTAVSGLGTMFIGNELRNKFLRFFLYPIYKFAFNHFNQKIIVQNKDDMKLLVEWGVLNPDKVQLLKGSGVKLENFTNLKEPDGIPTICFAARLLRDKGVYEFINAARIIKRKGIKAKFLLAGDLDINNPTSLNLEDLEIIKKEGFVEILGHYKDIPKLFSRSNVICLPSYREGFPKGLIEAAAASRAVVTTDVPGCRDAIIINKTGLIVPVKNSDKLADALQWLIEHPRERIAMGVAGRKLAEKEFLIETIVQQHLNIYKNLINNKT